jgi:hypothetical protein
MISPPSTPSYAPWLAFEDQLAARVRGLGRTGLQFAAGRQCIPGFPVDGFRADAALTDGRALLAVEVEVRQTHPDTNVGKYWLLSEYKKYDRIVLIHVYTPAYDSYGWRKTLGEFYAKRMKEAGEFEYVQLDERQAVDVAGATERVFARVSSLAVELFG